VKSPRDLPRIDELLEAAGDLVARYGRGASTGALRESVERARSSLLSGVDASIDTDALVASAAELLAARRPEPLRPVINATGVVVHTNLGRAPLSAEAVEAMTGAASTCDLEYDLAGGSRGSRGARLAPLIAEACGAEDGMAVNNAAGALVLALAALAAGKPVLVSRGELVEIGGSFRLPDILAASGARLVEVGTTNRTRAGDYAAAADGHPDAALILKVHPSNFQVSGFTESVEVSELAALARARGLVLLHDVGSGLLGPSDHAWLADEPDLHSSLSAGAHLAVCSGDKLLGGPQAGLIAGDAEHVTACRRHPLARALRLDKLRIAALQATLEAHLRGDRRAIPVWRMLDAEPAALELRAMALAAACGGDADVAAGESVVGGGSAPGAVIPTALVRIACASPERVARHLRHGDVAVVARVDDGALWLDPRTVDPADDALLAQMVHAALAAADLTAG
jgi:L-seryl-tRNA(Ser) seleniumtransferase